MNLPLPLNSHTHRWFICKEKLLSFHPTEGGGVVGASVRMDDVESITIIIIIPLVFTQRHP